MIFTQQAGRSGSNPWNDMGNLAPYLRWFLLTLRGSNRAPPGQVAAVLRARWTQIGKNRMIDSCGNVYNVWELLKDW